MMIIYWMSEFGRENNPFNHQMTQIGWIYVFVVVTKVAVMNGGGRDVSNGCNGADGGPCGVGENRGGAMSQDLNY